jgi:hypothetical protein
MYYREALAAATSESGEVLLELQLEGQVYFVPVNVICHPRMVVCNNGHYVVNTKNIISEIKETGSFSCPYCRLVPETISCNATVLYIQTSNPLTSEMLGIRVDYLDGHVEYVTPDSEEWQDDLDMNYCGTQEVTIQYRNKECKIMVITENPGCKKCGNTCNDRCRKDYELYPYCTNCLSEMYITTGKMREEEQILMGDELLTDMNTNGRILLQRGDFVVIGIKLKGYVMNLQRKIRINGKREAGA